MKWNVMFVCAIQNHAPCSWSRSFLQSVVNFAVVKTMYPRHFRWILLSIYLIIIQTGGNTQSCNDFPFEIRHDTRCWASDFVLDMTGVTHHHCILTCRTRKDCQFLNYQPRDGRCQLAGVCEALHQVTGIEAVLFGKVQLFNVQCMCKLDPRNWVWKLKTVFAPPRLCCSPYNRHIYLTRVNVISKLQGCLLQRLWCAYCCWNDGH